MNVYVHTLACVCICVLVCVYVCFCVFVSMPACMLVHLRVGSKCVSVPVCARLWVEINHVDNVFDSWAAQRQSLASLGLQRPLIWVSQQSNFDFKPRLCRKLAGSRLIVP